ncbi:MAG: extracellular solute-binding protein [Catenulisporales bacterium]|nr:extracellular solute-binding protein [Catenulisporales bacterium]
MQRIVGGRYELFEELGSGAFGRVWHGRDLTLGTEIAVKEIWPAAVSEADQNLWLVQVERENRRVAQLGEHLHIVTVRDVVVDDGKLWIIMDHVAGRTLAQVLAESGPLPVEQVDRIARGLLSALAAAHEKEIVHRDVKPGNVFLSQDGRALLTGFGIAVDAPVTASDARAGTLEYLPPERVNGAGATAAGDLYSLGVMLFQAAEGFSPFRRGTPAETLTAVVRDPAPVPGRAGRLAPLISALLAKDPAARPTATRALEGLGAPWPATATGGGGGTGGGRKRKPVGLIAAVAALTAAVVTVAAIVLSSGDSGSPTTAVAATAGTSHSTGLSVSPSSSSPSPSSSSTSSSSSTTTTAANGGDSVPPSSQDPDAPGSMTIWLASGTETLWPQAVDAAITAFHQTYPKVSVKVAYLPWDTLAPKLSTSLASNTPPDVMEVSTTFSSKLIAAGRLKDLTADKATFDNSSTWREVLTNSCTANGRLFCVPYFAAKRDGTILGGSDLAIPAAARHPEWSRAWIKAFTSTAVERQFAAVGKSSGASVTVLANSTAIVP